MILILLVVLAAACGITVATIIVKDITTRHSASALPPEFGSVPDCVIMVSVIKNAYITPYILAIIYEIGLVLNASHLAASRSPKEISTSGASVYVSEVEFSTSPRGSERLLMSWNSVSESSISRLPER
ncbi:hypothetical protein WG66_003773 [Moniliophthora roreri]|nr:hypothetical protein WG66_003773 [Moniliophthora roreri]